MAAAPLFKCLAAVLALCPAFIHAQRVQATPGTRHFIVLVDSSFSMVADARSPARRDDKRRALAQAEREITSLLYDAKAPWFRGGKDLITIVDYGFDSRGQANQAYKRLRYASLGTDYARRRVSASSNLTESSFRSSLRPRLRTHLNILAWALPMGIAAAAVPETRQIQETYIILLNDAQMNDGSMVLEKYTLGLHLSPTARARLREKEKLFSEAVVLTDADGQPGAYKQMSFGPATDQVVVTIFKAIPRTSVAAAEAYSNLDPLENADLDWAGGDALDVSFDPPKKLQGMKATVRIDGKVGHSNAPVQLDGSANATIRNLSPEGASRPAHLSLAVERTATNPLLGRQTFNMVFDREVLVPESPYSSARTIRWALTVLALLAAAGAAWAYYQRAVAKHFKFWLPDYTLPTSLPSLSQDVSAHFSSRVPRFDGEEAAWLELPHPAIRWLFYRNAVLRWDERLEVPGSTGTNEAKLTQLSRFVAFVWSRRPAGGGEYDVVIQRPSSRNRNHRLRATVRFLSLPQADPASPTP